jgi:putative nucleotidyltransferase with HDIG domain
MDLHAERLEALLAPHALEVPLLPEAAGRVMAAARAPDPDLRKVIELIQRDPALTGHVLRVANSAAYARGARLASLSQAVSRLGIAAIGEIALVVACRTRLFRAPGLEREVRQIFRHSYAAALFAQEIARSRRLDVETAFVSGLMHDVGRPLLSELVAGLAIELGSVEPSPWATLVDAHHAEVGAVIVDKWQLGPRVVETVRHHHDAVVAPAVALVQLADAICHLFLDESGDLDALARHPARLALNLYDDELAAIVAHREAVLTALDAIEGIG